MFKAKDVFACLASAYFFGCLAGLRFSKTEEAALCVKHLVTFLELVNCPISKHGQAYHSVHEHTLYTVRFLAHVFFPQFCTITMHKNQFREVMGLKNEY